MKNILIITLYLGLIYLAWSSANKNRLVNREIETEIERIELR